MTNIGYATLQVIPSARGFASALSRDAMPGAVGAGRQVGGSMGGGILAAAKGFVAPLAAVFAAGATLNFFKGAIEQASGLNESMNALQVVYGDAAEGVMGLGKNAAKSVGMSNLEFNNLAVRFSAFTKQIAGDGGDVVGTLDDLTGRAADFASVMNLEVAEAAQIFQSGLAGEAEPLRAYGIDMSAAAVEAYALSNGIATSASSMTEAQKVQARYGLLMEQTAQTQDDFANTSDQLANQQRILGSTWADLSARIGVLFLPALTKVVQAMNTHLMPAIEKGIAAVEALYAVFSTGDFTAEIGKALGGVEEDSPIVGIIFSIRDAFESLSGSIDLGSVMTLLSPMSTLLKGLAPTLPILANAVMQVGKALGEALGGALEALMPVIPVVATALGQIGMALAGGISSVLPLVAQLLGTLGTVLSTTIAAILPTIVALVQSLVTVIVALLPALMPVIQALVDGLTVALVAIGPLLVTVAQVLGEALMMILPVLVPIIGILAEVLVQVINAVVPLIPPIVELAAAFLPILPVVAELIATLLPPLISLLVGLIPPVTNLVTGLIGSLVPALTTVVGGISVIITWISNLLTWFVGLFTGATNLSGQLTGVWNSIKSSATSIWNALVSYVAGIPGRLSSGLSSIGTSVRATVASGVESVKNGATEKFNALVTFVQGIPGKISSALGNMGSLLYQKGRDTIQGLLNGAGSLLSTIGTFFLSKLPGWIQGPFKQALGIHSPSRVFAGYGKNIGEGLILGVNGMKDEVGATMEDLVTPPSLPAFGSPTSAAGAGIANRLAASLSMPSVLEVRDVDGDLVGRMQVEAGRVQEGAVTPLHLGRSSW